MKVSGFLRVTEKFWGRAAMFFPEKAFADEVKRLSRVVREALKAQLGIEYRTDDDWPREAEMGQSAREAVVKLCQYLDEKDSGNNYQAIAETG